MSHHDENYAELEDKAAHELRQKRAVAILRLNEALSLIRQPTSREHSIASTHIETAILWLQK